MTISITILQPSSQRYCSCHGVIARGKTCQFHLHGCTICDFCSCWTLKVGVENSSSRSSGRKPHQWVVTAELIPGDLEKPEQNWPDHSMKMMPWLEWGAWRFFSVFALQQTNRCIWQNLQKSRFWEIKNILNNMREMFPCYLHKPLISFCLHASSLKWIRLNRKTFPDK